MVTEKLYKRLANVVNAIETCNKEWKDRYLQMIELIESECLPSGSGFDCGTKVDLDASNKNKLVLTSEFHHMDEMGGYGGWSNMTITIKPDMISDVDIHINCHGSLRKKYQNTLDYWYDVFESNMKEMVELDYDKESEMYSIRRVA